jgi:phosphomethylpyrimidine synthase
MRISQDVRRYAADRGLAEDRALEAGLAEKAAEFAAEGGRIYLPVTDGANGEGGPNPT